MYCSETSLVNTEGDGFAAVTLKCRSWQCEICQPMRAARLRQLAAGGSPNTFITLTVNPKTGTDPADRARALADAWRKVCKAACRKYGYKNIPFLAVFEKTKNGEPHLHIVARIKWLDQAWLSARMSEYISAPIVDIRRISDVKKATAYITKYVTKDPTQFGKCKRYWCSRNYELKDPQADRLIHRTVSIWEKREVCLRDLARMWVNEGRRVTWPRGDFAIAEARGTAGWLSSVFGSN